MTFCHFQTWICTTDFNVPCLSLLILTTKVGTNTLDREESQRHCLNSGMGQPDTAAQGSHVRRGAVPCWGSLSHQTLLTMRGFGTGTCLIPGRVHPHSSMLTDQLLLYVWVPPGRASSSPWTMVTVRLQTPGSVWPCCCLGWANRARASPGPGRPRNQNCGLTASHLQSPLLEAHSGKEPDSSVFQISSSEPPDPCGSQQPTPSDFPCWPCPEDHHQGTMVCPGLKTRMTWLSPQR